MADFERERRVAAFRALLNDRERWADQYVARPDVTAAEREAGRSLQQYILQARVYAAGPRPSGAEMDRRERKINQMWTGLFEAFLRRTRRR